MACLAAGALPTGAAAAKGSLFDCVIEPALTIEIGSPVSGIIDEVMVGRGDVVSRGTVIARLRSEIEVATLDIARARAFTTLPVDIARSKAELARKELDRTRELHQRAVAATATLDKAVTDYDQAVLALRTAEQDQRQANLEMGRAQIVVDVRTIRSPIDGVVAQVMQNSGEHAHEQTKIVRIVRVDPLFVEVYLPISLYPFVQVGMTGEVRPAEPIGGNHKALITVVDKVFDSASDTFGIRLNLPNPASKMPAGINCKVGFPGIDN